MHHSPQNTQKEYLKFFAVLLLVTALAFVHVSWVREYATVSSSYWLQYLDSFMGVFFVVFGSFKLINLKEFAYGFQSYDVIAKRSLLYSFAYPFMQLIVGFLYLYGLNAVSLDIFVLVISLVSGYGVLKSLRTRQDVHCVCLGNVIKLPLSRISFVEDFGMAIMAAIMILNR